MEKASPEIFVESIFDQSVKHTTGFDRHDEVDIVFNQFQFFGFHIVRNSVARVTDIVTGVDSHPFPSAIPLIDCQISNHSGTILFWSKFEVLTHAFGHNFQIFC
uniref:Uncharacterized protein n=1 Tax=uncultured marine group II/III euryarchaeote KM3_192_C12 TaxID=1457964 RepID=A0A075GVZ8_9EURY|nr:hypothetical protein [uncultured marine group II/III euryarchaeote KM3_192_C12]